MVLAAVVVVLEIVLFSLVFIFVFQKLLICSEVLLPPKIIERGERGGGCRQDFFCKNRELIHIKGGLSIEEGWGVGE